jgi:hypothetical protein
MFAHIHFRHSQNTVAFFRNVGWLLGIRRNRRQVVFRIPPSAR